MHDTWQEIEKHYDSYAEQHAKSCPFCARTPMLYSCNYFPDSLHQTEPGMWMVVLRCKCIWNPMWWYKAKNDEELKENINKLVTEWNTRENDE